jgi:hypothetical protein
MLLLVVIATLAAVVETAAAQAPVMTPGSKVRLTLGGQSGHVVGILQEQSPDSLRVAVTIEHGSLRTYDMDDVIKIEKWGKRRGVVGRSWALGTGIGALAGMGIGLAVPPACEGGGWCIGPDDQGDMVALGLVAGALLGGVIGAISGAMMSHGWLPLDLNMIRSAHVTGIRMSWSVPLPAIRAP